MNDEYMEVVYICEGERPKRAWINKALNNLQKMVDGNIEMYAPFKDDAVIICNEEGKIRGLRPNRAIRNEEGEVTDIICGDFFICKAPYESDTFESLDEKQLKTYQEMFERPEIFYQKGRKVVVLPVADMYEINRLYEER